MSNLHFEILDEIRQKMFSKLSVFAPNSYLAGGTGLALQIGHRFSYDFDLFTKEPITDETRKQAIKVFGSNLHLLLDSPTQLTFLTPENIKISLTTTV